MNFAPCGAVSFVPGGAVSFVPGSHVIPVLRSYAILVRGGMVPRPSGADEQPFRSWTDVHVQCYILLSAIRSVRRSVWQGGVGGGFSILRRIGCCIIFHHIFFIPKLCPQFPESGRGRRALVVGYKAEFRLAQGLAVLADLFQERRKISLSSKIRVRESIAFPHGFLCFIHGQESSRSGVLLQKPVFIPVLRAGKAQAVRQAALGRNPAYIFLFFPG